MEVAHRGPPRGTTAGTSTASSDGEEPTHITTSGPSAGQPGAPAAQATARHSDVQRLRRQRAKEQKAEMQAQLERMQAELAELALENSALAVQHQALAQMDVHQQELLSTLQRAHAGAALRSSRRIQEEEIRSVLCTIMDESFRAGRTFEDSVLRSAYIPLSMNDVLRVEDAFLLRLDQTMAEWKAAPSSEREALETNMRVALWGRVSHN